MIRANRFARIDSRESRCESPVPLRKFPLPCRGKKSVIFPQGVKAPLPQALPFPGVIAHSEGKRKLFFREAPDTFNFLRHVMRAIWSGRPKCSHRCVSLTEISLTPVQIVKHRTKNSAEQTAMRTKWFKHIAI